MDNPIKSSIFKGIKIIYDDPLELIEKYDEEKNIRNGFCLKQWKDGREFKGYYLNNKINGWAILNKSNFELKGDFCDDILNGYGEYFDKEENTTLKGYWVNGKAGGIVIEIDSDYKYFGSFINNAKNGFGKQIWTDNEVYEGSYEDGLFNGYGIYYFKNGDQYIGEWKNNEKCGFGQLKYSDGKIYMGYFKEDKKDGFGIYRLSEDNFSLNFWKKGKRDGLGKFIKGNHIKFSIWKENKNIQNINEKEFMQKIIKTNKNYLPLFKWSINEINKFFDIE